MSDSEIRNDEYNKAAVKIVYPIVGLLALKWIVILGLNRWARSVK